jgi:DNA-binding transcriptional LysR family regulator
LVFRFCIASCRDWTKKSVRKKTIDEATTKLSPMNRALSWGSAAPLLHRGPGGVTLTEAGEVLARRVGEMLADIEVLMHTVREVALNPPRAIRIAVPPGPSPDIVIHTLQFIQQLWSDARIDLRVQDTVKLDPREVDLCITLSREVPDGPYHVYQVGCVDVLLIASRRYLEESGPISTLEDLQRHPLFRWVHPDVPAGGGLPCRSGEELPIVPTLTTNDAHVVHELVEAGHGIGFVVHHELFDDPFVPVLRDEVGTALPTRLLVSTAVTDSPRIRTLMEHLEAILGAPSR